MIKIDLAQAEVVRPWFLPERPGPLTGLHVLNTGHGSIYADRWPEPRVLLAQTADNYALCGDPAALPMAQLRGRIAGFVEAPEDFLPSLRDAFPRLRLWQRVVKQLPNAPPPRAATDAQLGPITGEDAGSVAELSPEIEWISKTWGGPAGLATSGYAWGAFEGNRLISVACTFFLGDQYEDVGVVTEPGYRARGLAAACAAALCRDILDRGRIPSWTTSPDNEGSLRVASRLGFELHREDRLYLIDRPVPGSVPLG